MDTVNPQVLDDDGRPKRTGNVWTASAHIVTAVIGSGVLSLAWAIAQLGWVVGPATIFGFAVVTYIASALLADCYRSDDLVSAQRNRTYMDAVRSNLGGLGVTFCGVIQYLTIFGTAIGFTLVASLSMEAIYKANCFHKKGKQYPCTTSTKKYMIIFGVIEIFFSQIPNFDQISGLSKVAAIMSFTYSFIGFALGMASVVQTREIKGSARGVAFSAMNEPDNIWKGFQALGNIAFAYSYSMILIEIQDTLKSPPKESETMKKAAFISVAITTIFYTLCACLGYAAFGDQAPGNLITGFGFYEPFWLLNIANVAVVIHLVGAYQLYCQPLFNFVEDKTLERFSNNGLISFKVNLFRLVWRTCFVVITTVFAMPFPFFNDVLGLLGALAFWPLTVHYPVKMYIKRKKIRKWSSKWVLLNALNVACFVISLVAAIGSVAAIVKHAKIASSLHSLRSKDKF